MHKLLPDLPDKAWYIILIVLFLISIFSFLRSKKTLKENDNEKNRYFHKESLRLLIFSSAFFIIVTILFLFYNEY